MRNLIYPTFPVRCLPAMLGIAVLGGLAAGAYGVIHDQVTYTLAPEYFTKFKFEQFSYADWGWPRRAFVAVIGFLATWWVGFFSAWFIARVTVPKVPLKEAFRLSMRGFLIVFSVAFAGALVGYTLGVSHGPDYGKWSEALSGLHVEDVRRFMCVGYIHNAGYLGGLAGLIAAVIYLRTAVRR